MFSGGKEIPKVIASKCGKLIATLNMIDLAKHMFCRLTRNVGDIFAYSVFAWRYLNVPANWGYVASRWSIGIIVMTFVPEVVFPFIYCWVIARRSKALGMEFTGRDTRRLDLKDD